MGKYARLGGWRAGMYSYLPQGETIWPVASGKGPTAGGGLGHPQPGLLPPTPPPHFSPSSQEPSPYDESEVHDSFHQLIQEQSQWVAEEGLELQHRGSGAGTPGASGEPRGGGH